jgi:hypothetical protein
MIGPVTEAGRTSQPTTNCNGLESAKLHLQSISVSPSNGGSGFLGRLPYPKHLLQEALSQ